MIQEIIQIALFGVACIVAVAVFIFGLGVACAFILSGMLRKQDEAIIEAERMRRLNEEKKLNRSYIHPDRNRR